MIDPFDSHQEERMLISSMLLSYANIEMSLLHVLSAVMPDIGEAAVALFTQRGESNRITVVELVVRPWFTQQGMADDLSEAIAAISLCKDIRNQYAHALFVSHAGRLGLAKLESAVRSRKGARSPVQARMLSPELLKAQWTYFNYADHQLLWIGQNYRIRTGQPMDTYPLIPRPDRLAPPPLNTLFPKKAPR